MVYLCSQNQDRRQGISSCGSHADSGPELDFWHAWGR
ncbi:hypothetical protein FOFC_14747 [Fusarium oxysporum]|nr:hypothetical protein FOFC_14747 [Fusarium oxysporum]